MNLGLNLNLGVAGGSGSPPAVEELVQWLYTNDGDNATDRIGTLDEPSVVDSNCLTCDGAGDKVTINGSLLNNATIWTVQFEIPAYTYVNGIEFIVGDGTATKSIAMSVGSYYAQFRDSAAVYHPWNGTGNTSIYLTSAGGNFVFTSDGTNIHMYVDGTHYGYITPGTTQINFNRYGAGHPSLSYTGKIFSMAAWNTYSSDGSYDYSTAIFAHPLSEGVGDIAYDVSGSGESGTLVPNGSLELMRSTGGGYSYNLLYGCTRLSDTYTVTDPAGGVNRTYNPNTDTQQNTFDTLATVINDLKATTGTYTITEPTGGWLYTYNPNTATLTQFYDAVATIANNIDGTATAFTLTEPSGGRVRTFDPNEDSRTTAQNVLGTLLLDLQESGVIG